jgi:peroxiredoxin Q/BCP
MLDAGDTAPPFELPDQDGNPVSLSAFEGQRVVLYFYPKAMTPGCTREARTFQDHHDAFAQLDVAILGVSADPVDEIGEFADAEGLDFRLLADEDGTVAERYDSFGEREHEGETWEIAFRNTYLIGPDGRIERAYEDVSPDDHAEEVLADVRRLAGE